MSKKFLLINFLLILIAVFLAVRSYDVWMSPMPERKEPGGTRQRAPASASTVSSAQKMEMPVPAAFKNISEKNIFSPDRKEFPIVLPAAEMKKPSVRPNVTLYGVALGEAFTSALVSNPNRRTDRGERESMSVKVGDKVGEYTVSKILGDRITLESAGDSFDVLLYDPARQKKRPTVSPAGPAPSPGSSPPLAPVPPRPAIRTPGSPPPPVIPPPTVPPASVTTPSSPAGPPGRTLIRGRMDPRAIPPPSRPAPASPNEEEDEEGE